MGPKIRAPKSVGKSVPNFSLFHEIREEVGVLVMSVLGSNCDLEAL